MAFIPDPADVDEYQKGCQEGRVFQVDALRQCYSQYSIEQAIQKIQHHPGSVIIYWKAHPESTPEGEHYGCCHILCSTMDLTNHIKQRLDGLEPQRGSNKHSTVTAISNPKKSFERVTRLEPCIVSPEAQPGRDTTALLAVLAGRAQSMTKKVSDAREENENFARWIGLRGLSAGSLGYRNVSLLREVLELIQNVEETVNIINQSPSSNVEPQLNAEPHLTWHDLISENEMEEADVVEVVEVVAPGLDAFGDLTST